MNIILYTLYTYICTVCIHTLEVHSIFIRYYSVCMYVHTLYSNVYTYTNCIPHAYRHTRTYRLWYIDIFTLHTTHIHKLQFHMYCGIHTVHTRFTFPHTLPTTHCMHMKHCTNTHFSLRSRDCLSKLFSMLSSSTGPADWVRLGTAPCMVSIFST